MRVVSVMLALLLTAALPSAVAVRLLTGDTCNALTSTSLQMKGEKLGSVAVPSRESCCEECKKMTGCQMWWFQDNTSPFMCEMYSLDKGPVTWNIQYKTRAGLMNSGPSAVVERSDECGGGVWLLKGVAIEGVVKGGATDPYVAEERGFKNGFPAKTWLECCEGALGAPGTSLMERHYQYRGYQYWTWNPSEGKCYVAVRPFQVGAQVLTLKRSAGVISGMFGNEP